MPQAGHLTTQAPAQFSEGIEAELLEHVLLISPLLLLGLDERNQDLKYSRQVVYL